MNSVNWKNTDIAPNLVYRYLQSLGPIVSIIPLYFSGPIAGSEFETYQADKMYLCINSEFSGTINLDVGGYEIEFYNPVNVLTYMTNNNSCQFDAAGAPVTFLNGVAKVDNIAFSRLVTYLYTYIKFIGYRIIY